MSILIEGMEMPKFFDRIFFGKTLSGEIHARFDNREDDQVEWYPVKEIPDGSMAWKLLNCCAMEEKHEEI